MPSSTPPRKFAPVLVEETSKSTRQPPEPEESKPKPRRFAPEPVEETTKSSKEPRRHGPEDAPPPRRFAPAPVEHTTKSSKDKKQDGAGQDGKSKPRRFAPQMVEETVKSSHDRPVVDKKPHIKFAPEVISTTYSSSKNRKAKQAAAAEPMEMEKEKRPPRKFTPILLDTARRVRRAGDPNAPIPQDYRTEYGYHAHSREHWRRVNGQITPIAASEATSDDVDMEDVDAESTPSLTERRREVCALDGSSSRRSDCLIPSRQHSFRLPDLDTIESSESDRDSETSSSPASAQRAPITPSDSTFELFKHATRIRESIDENFTHYLLDLERKKAQQRLEEQALAAFPNADFGYEPPHHYFIHDDSDEFEIEDRPVTYEEEDDLIEMRRRRDSTWKETWEQREMQRHAEELQQERNAQGITAPKEQVSQAPWGVPAGFSTAPADAEMKSMRERARPPMLGTDLVFPRCKSPDPARFDVTQGSASLRNRMCYLTEAAEAAEAERKKSGEDGNLWKARKPKEEAGAMWSPASAKGSQAKGLWGGFCVNDGKNAASAAGQAPPPGPTGLMTPKNETANSFELAFAEGRPVRLMTPGTPNKKKKTDLSNLSAVLVSEREFDAMMEREYPDSFITQVYNYLSLGYPSVANPFDDELSKISRIPVADLRQDDQKARATPRGYIRLGSDFEGGGGEGMTEDSCVRWQALKKYVREWARQEKNMVKDVGSGWGTGARRGSWAI